MVSVVLKECRRRRHWKLAVQTVIHKDARTELDALCDQQLIKIAECVRFVTSGTRSPPCTFHGCLAVFCYESVLVCLVLYLQY